MTWRVRNVGSQDGDHARTQGIVPVVPSLPSDSGDPISRADDELGQTQQNTDFLAENADLHRRLEQSEAARRDLVAQTEHLIELLAVSRKKIRELKGPSAPTDSQN